MASHPDRPSDPLPQAQERFIRDQIAGLRELGFSEKTLEFEERALRAGFTRNKVLFGLMEALGHGEGALCK